MRERPGSKKKDGEVRERTTPPEKLRNWPALIEELVMAGHSNGVQCPACCQGPYWLIYGAPSPGKYTENLAKVNFSLESTPVPNSLPAIVTVEKSSDRKNPLDKLREAQSLKPAGSTCEQMSGNPAN